MRTGTSLPAAAFRNIVDEMFRISGSRGREAAGLLAIAGDRAAVHKEPVSATEFCRGAVYAKLLDDAYARAVEAGQVAAPLAILGHCRLATNGLQSIPANNQPVIVGDAIAIHNGIVVNDDALWQKHPDLRKSCDVDTEIVAALLDKHQGSGMAPEDAIRQVFREIEGAATVATFDAARGDLLLATNTGSLYFAVNRAETAFVFMSEDVMLRELIGQGNVNQTFGGFQDEHLTANRGIHITIPELARRPFAILPATDVAPEQTSSQGAGPGGYKIFDPQAQLDQARQNLRRCARCILPETMPYIRFDAEGVCNYCRQHQPQELHGREKLEALLAKHRRGDGRPDCIVAFSGGRDSSYALHLLRREFGMTPIAYTYDWGMVNELARRNQSRLTGKLGIEHIIVSADIVRKRRYIKKNIEAWMRKPTLGMIPLFMAGDKQFYYYANKLSKDTGIGLTIFCDNQHERTYFKSGFANVNDKYEDNIFDLSVRSQVGMIAYYLKQFVSNRRYINSSIFDTMTGYYSYYVMNKNYEFLFDYIEWDEREIDNTLIGEYDWETAEDTSTTWRIGDGTAATYNYIYHTVAGFTENDTFRSSQIRAGALPRQTALELVQRENQARFDSMLEYCQLVDVNFDDLLRTINRMPRLYAPA